MGGKEDAKVVSLFCLLSMDQDVKPWLLLQHHDDQGLTL